MIKGNCSSESRTILENSRHHVPTDNVGPFPACKTHTHTTYNSPIRSDEGPTPKTSALKLLTVAIDIINSTDKTKITFKFIFVLTFLRRRSWSFYFYYFYYL